MYRIWQAIHLLTNWHIHCASFSYFTVWLFHTHISVTAKRITYHLRSLTLSFASTFCKTSERTNKWICSTANGTTKQTGKQMDKQRDRRTDRQTRNVYFSDHRYIIVLQLQDYRYECTYSIHIYIGIYGVVYIYMYVW